MAAYGGHADAFALGNWDAAQRLTIRFDERGVVSDVSLERKGCSDELESTDCRQTASGADLAFADRKRQDEQLIASSGSVIGRYERITIERGSDKGCSYAFHVFRGGSVTLIVAQRRLLWQPRHWDLLQDSMAFEDIDDVKAMEVGFAHHRVPVLARDGSCLFLEGEKRELEKVRTQIVAALAASRAEHN
jgi:hypothetical protein